MMHIRRFFLTIAVLFFVSLISGETTAAEYRLGLKVNHTTVDASLERIGAVRRGNVCIGVVGTYKDTDYWTAGGKVSMTSNQLHPDFQYGVGFKGLGGNVEQDHRDEDLALMAFTVDLSYDIPPAVNPIPLPIDLYAGVSMAPKPLCFSDGKTYGDFRLGTGWYIMENAIIFAEYRYTEFRFEDVRSVYDNIALIGYSVRF
ncbi:MAG: hypothetical protein CSA22_02810 [Deltaproteobacteria bacterium]|nr:MAG: hypothetical protein CSA22_02810 [Deltaproteobacteria bacterium]